MNLVWFRNDLRVEDNTSLYLASQNDLPIIGVYCFDPKQFSETPWGFKKTEKFRAQFIIESITTLKQNLAKYNIPLFIYLDTPENIIPRIISEYEVSTILSQKEWTSEEVTVEQNINSGIPESIEWVKSFDQFLFHPEDINFDIAKTPEVFTVFRKKLEKYITVREENTIAFDYEQQQIQNNTTVPSLQDLGFDTFDYPVQTAFPFKGGEEEAWGRLESYFWETKKLSFYKKTRNGLVGKDYSSKFSPWLANGCISARSIYHEVKRYEKEVKKNDSTYWLVFELIWRDYFKYVSLKHHNQIFN